MSTRAWDLGIAKLLDSRVSDTGSELTRARDRVLTPEYASPEQLRGEPLGTVSDVLYVLLSGSHPHARPDQTLLELESAVCSREPPAPSARLREIANSTGSRDLYPHARDLSGDSYCRAARVFERSLAIRTAGGRDHTPEFADTLEELANAQRFLGRFGEAERSFKQAPEMHVRLYPPPSAPVAATMTHLGTLSPKIPFSRLPTRTLPPTEILRARDGSG